MTPAGSPGRGIPVFPWLRLLRKARAHSPNRSVVVVVVAVVLCSGASEAKKRRPGRTPRSSSLPPMERGERIGLDTQKVCVCVRACTRALLTERTPPKKELEGNSPSDMRRPLQPSMTLSSSSSCRIESAAHFALGIQSRLLPVVPSERKTQKQI